ncbi:acyltransferase family protein [Novosphingobium sp. KACC 22771]|uniref:acyltransferase family protein n=1 Tax=Novosphingobium sp. KACC 22771 TaxID=3025670 RepID=UPI002366A1D5|nr:acyltransferase family protein [Novosphingobium sp. KACC 22771]WDF72058.1 acyltransferase family protein [Novosphingobium sp. KACC 22771]
MASHPKPFHRADIDGLRAISVGVVVAFHAWWRQGFGGFVGVDIFFVISGYLISGAIFDDVRAGRFSLAAFYGRRVRRIYPALITVLLATFAFGWVQLFDDRFQQLGAHLVGAAVFASNLVLYAESGYFDASSDAKPLLHLWSLGVEEQFYILWPLAVMLAWRSRGARGVVWTLGLGFAASMAHEQFLMRINTSAAFYIPTARFWEMLAGAALAWVERRRVGAMPLRMAHGFSLIGLALLLGSFRYITEGKVPFPGWAALAPVGGAVLLLAAGPRAVVNARLLLLLPMRWLGQISYPLYLWHWPVLVLARTSGWVDGWAMLVCVGVATGLAWVTARWIEPPLRYGGDNAKKVKGLLAAMAVLGLGGLVVAWAHVPSASHARVAPITRQIGWGIPVASEAQGRACNALMPGRGALVPGVAGNDFCYLARPGAPDVALVGDSLNLSLFPGLASYGDINVLIASASEAAPFYDTTTTESFDRTRLNNWKLTNQALDYAVASPSIRVVVLSYANGDQLLRRSSAHDMTDRADPTPAPPEARLERALRRTLARLTAAGKGVIITLPNRRMGFDPPDCLTDLRPLHGPAYRHPCGEPRGGALEQAQDAYAAQVRRVAKDFPGVVLVDLAAPLCDARLCYAMRGGQMYYRDRLHLSDAGSRAVAPVLYDAIRAMMHR